jgi:O-antigen/teichoic acid export membrane protein
VTGIAQTHFIVKEPRSPGQLESAEHLRRRRVLERWAVGVVEYREREARALSGHRTRGSTRDSSMAVGLSRNTPAANLPNGTVPKLTKLTGFMPVRDEASEHRGPLRVVLRHPVAARGPSGDYGGQPRVRRSMAIPHEQLSPPEDNRAGIAARLPRSIASGALESLIYRGAAAGALALTVIITSRVMEPAGRGLYALASVAAGVCGLVFGSIWIANAVELSRRRLTTSELFGGSIVIAAVGGTATALIAFACAPLAGDRWWLIALPAAVTPFMLLSRYQEGLFTAVGDIRSVNVMTIARAVLPLLFIGVPLLAGASARTAIALWVLWWVALAVGMYLPARSVFGRPRRPGDRGYYARATAYGTKMSGITAATTLYDRVGLFVLALFASDAEVGVLSVAIAGRELVLIAGQSVALSAFHDVGVGSRKDPSRLTMRAVRHAALLGGAGSIAVVLVSLPLVRPVIGPGYEDVPGLIALLAPSTVALGALYQFFQFFEVRVATAAIPITIAASALLANAILSTALAPMWGAAGVAVGTSVAYLVAVAVAFWYFRRATGARATELLPGRQEIGDYVALIGPYAKRLRRDTRG